MNLSSLSAISRQGLTLLCSLENPSSPSPSPRCPSCEILYINGVKTHEAGCPDAWQDETRECKWCGSRFVPESREDRFCCEDCMISYST